MKKMSYTKSFLFTVCLLLVIPSALSACGQKQDLSTAPAASQSASSGSQKSENALKGTVSVVGSTSVQPLAQELADAFSKINPGVKVDVQGVGSTAGIKAAYDGTSDIGTSSRDLKKEELEWKLTEHVIALDGIAVVVKPKNPVSDLSVEQITKIFKGEIKNWKEVGGPDKEILVISREDGSGTKGAFEELTKLLLSKDGKEISLLRADALIANGNGEVKANVAGKENAIGYMSLGSLDGSIKALKVGGVEATAQNIKDKKYSISRPFIMLTKGDPKKPEVKAYIDFILGPEGQKIVSKHYIPVK